MKSLLYFFEGYVTRAGACGLVLVDTTFADLLSYYNSTLPPNFSHMSIGDEVALGKALRLLFGAACIAGSWSFCALHPSMQRGIVFVKSRVGRPRSDTTKTLSVLIGPLSEALSRQGAGPGLSSTGGAASLIPQAVPDGDVDILSDAELERLHKENLEDEPDENAEPSVDPTIYSTTITRAM